MRQFNIFNDTKEELIQLEDAEISWFADMGLPESSMADLLQSIDWQEETIRIAGVERLVPRLIAWYGDNGAEYQYSGVRHYPKGWTQELLQIKNRVEKLVGQKFNSALCNLYRDGQDSVAWHSDDELELGEKPVIASVSFGATRTFQLKHKTKPKLRHKISLTSGSLLLMKAGLQENWQHQVPKEPHITEPRVNITFRNIIKSQ